MGVPKFVEGIDSQLKPSNIDAETWNHVYNLADSRLYNRVGKDRVASKACRESGETAALAVTILQERGLVREGSASSFSAPPPPPQHANPGEQPSSATMEPEKGQDERYTQEDVEGLQAEVEQGVEESNDATILPDPRYLGQVVGGGLNLTEEAGSDAAVLPEPEYFEQAFQAAQVPDVEFFDYAGFDLLCNSPARPGPSRAYLASIEHQSPWLAAPPVGNPKAATANGVSGARASDTPSGYQDGAPIIATPLPATNSPAATTPPAGSNIFNSTPDANFVSHIIASAKAGQYGPECPDNPFARNIREWYKYQIICERVAIAKRKVKRSAGELPEERDFIDFALDIDLARHMKQQDELLRREQMEGVKSPSNVDGMWEEIRAREDEKAALNATKQKGIAGDNSQDESTPAISTQEPTTVNTSAQTGGTKKSKQRNRKKKSKARKRHAVAPQGKTADDTDWLAHAVAADHANEQSEAEADDLQPSLAAQEVRDTGVAFTQSLVEQADGILGYVASEDEQSDTNVDHSLVADNGGSDAELSSADYFLAADNGDNGAEEIIAPSSAALNLSLEGFRMKSLGVEFDTTEGLDFENLPTKTFRLQEISAHQYKGHKSTTQAPGTQNTVTVSASLQERNNPGPVAPPIKHATLTASRYFDSSQATIVPPFDAQGFSARGTASQGFATTRELSEPEIDLYGVSDDEQADDGAARQIKTTPRNFDSPQATTAPSSDAQGSNAQGPASQGFATTQELSEPGIDLYGVSDDEK